MRSLLLLALIGLPITVESALAASVNLPYTSGKQVFDFTLSNGPDSVRVGNRFVFARAFWPGPFPAVCGYQVPIGIRVHGARMMGRKNMDTSWMAYPAFPSAQDSLVDLDLIGGRKEPSNPAAPEVGGSPGFWYAQTGGQNDCQGNQWSFREGARRVAFVEGGGAYAKIKLISYRDSVETYSPMLRFAYLTRVTFRMVVNTSPNDLVDPNPPAALARAVRKPGASVGGVKAFYDVRGIRWNAAPERPTPLLPRSESP